MDDPLVWAVFRVLLSSEESVVVGEAADGAEAARHVQVLHPDVVLVDRLDVANRVPIALIVHAASRS